MGTILVATIERNAKTALAGGFRLLVAGTGIALFHIRRVIPYYFLCGASVRFRCSSCIHARSSRRRLIAFTTTMTVERLMTSAPISGRRKKPQPAKIPAAAGMAITL